MNLSEVHIRKISTRKFVGSLRSGRAGGHFYRATIEHFNRPRGKSPAPQVEPVPLTIEAVEEALS